ncbi:Lrp/AsnC family transcriptional regulator [Corynebacterium sp. 335C]
MRHDHPVELTEHDLELINVLQWSPRITWGDAAEILGVHPTTLSTRWERLTSAGLAWVNALRRTDGGAAVAFAEIRCAPAHVREVTDHMTALPGVVSADVLAGTPDLGLTLIADDLRELHGLIRDGIRSAPHVTASEVMLCTRLHVAGHQWRLDALDDRRAGLAREAAERDAAALGPAQPLLPEHRPVLEVLRRDGRASAAEIARETGLHPATARRYLHKVLASGEVTLRCDFAQLHSGYPLSVQWLARLDAREHEAAAERLAADPRVRLVASLAGQANLVVTMWISDIAGIVDAECALEEACPGLEIDHNLVTLRPVKRFGWILDGDGLRTGRYVGR